MDTIAIAQVNNNVNNINGNNGGPPALVGENWDHTYRPLPDLFFGLALLWMLLVVVWTANTWSKRRWQTSNLQWVLTVIPAMKSLVMGLSFVFWYSCLHLKTCSFWVAFGVFVSRIFFETACFVTFLLISYGYCIMHEQLSLTERRSVAGLTSLLYLTLTGYKAAVPQFAVLIIFIYAVLLYVIMAHIARNLSLLREQLQQIQAEGVHMMQNAVHTKYTMFRKFQGAMLAMVVAEILMHAQAESVVNEYWVRLLVREITEVTIFFFIGWTFRSREQTPFFNVMPTSNTSGQRILAPIYSVEMNERQFSKLDYKEWHIGVPTPISRTGDRNRPMLVIVQNPGVSDVDNEPLPSSLFKMSATFQPSSWPDPSSSHEEPVQLRLREHSSSTKTSTAATVTATATTTTTTTTATTTTTTGFEDAHHWDTECHTDDCAGYVEDMIAVDVKGLKNYSFLPFESPCCEVVARPLHSRSNSSKSLQVYQSYNK